MHTEMKCIQWQITGGTGGTGGTVGGSSEDAYGSFWGDESSPEQFIQTRIGWCNWNFTRTPENWQSATIINYGVAIFLDYPIILSSDVGMPYFSEKLGRIIPKWEAQQLADQTSFDALSEVGKLYQQGKLVRSAVPGEVTKRMQQKINHRLGFTTQVAKVSTIVGTNGGPLGSRLLYSFAKNAQIK